MTENNSLINAEAIYKSYGELKVLKGISLKISKGEVVSLVGSSGAGKSTLLHVLGTLDKPDSGTIIFNETDIHELPDKMAAAFRNKNLGFIFQFHHLLPEFTAHENVCIPGFIANINTSNIKERAKELLENLGLGDRLNHKPSQLSGGEQQRVAVARAMINEPQLILADEPTGNLDSSNSEEIWEVVTNLAHQNNVSFLIATHDLKLAERADRKLRIVDGVIAK